MKNPEVTLAGERFQLLGHAAYWPAERALIVADLHLGKAETFQRSGLAVPSGHGAADLARLERLLGLTGAERLYVLGDLLHARSGFTDDLKTAFGAWLRRLSARAVLVPGNHDRRAGALPEDWALGLAPDLERRGIRLVHEPLPDEAPPHLCGHLHPVVRLRSAVDALRLPCFVLEPGRLLLPAFGSFTGGLEMRPRQGRTLYVVADDRVVPLGAAIPGRATPRDQTP